MKTHGINLLDKCSDLNHLFKEYDDHLAHVCDKLRCKNKLYRQVFLNIGLSRTGHWRMGSEFDYYAATVSSAV